MIDWSLVTPGLWTAIAVILGLCMGSFLNVVVYRLPRMMEKAWDTEVQLHLGQTVVAQPTFNLALPRSHCPRCQTTLAWYDNVPVLSWILLTAKCRHCKAPIPWRYPLIEILTSALFLAVSLQYPPGYLGLAIMGFTATLLALAFIDWDTFLLPDQLTLPLVWAGLLVNLISEAIPLQESVWGATLGYGVLWALFHGFKWITGKEGMGYGDFKLLAASGAWWGVQSLLSILLVASVSGIVFGLIVQRLRGEGREAPFPFGPSLVFGTFSWMAGFDAMRWMNSLF